MRASLPSALRDAVAAPRAALAGWLAQLEVRERRLVGAAATVGALVLSWLVVVEPVSEALERMDRGLKAAQRDATVIDELTVRHRRLKEQVAVLERAGGGSGSDASVFAQLESIAVPIAGRERIAAMNPSTRAVANQLAEESVEIRLDGISMRTLVNLLHAVEQRERPLTLVRLSFKRQYKNPELVDASLVVSRLKPQ